MRYSPEIAAAMYERRMDGETLERIGRDFGVGNDTVLRWVDRYVRSGAVELVG